MRNPSDGTVPGGTLPEGTGADRSHRDGVPGESRATRQADGHAVPGSGTDRSGRDGTAALPRVPAEIGAASAYARDGAVVVRLTGEVDGDRAVEVEAAFLRAAGAAAPLTVVDLSRTTFADSMLLHRLHSARQAAVAEGRGLVVAGPVAPAVARLFEVTGTAEWFDFAPTLDEALGG
jgi:anti-sigma B factor antagonist